MAIQLVEGGVDASVFENFIYELLLKVRGDRKNDDRPVILFMDNATIHRQPIVVKTILGMKVFLLFTPQYSPQLNPVEKFFYYLKSQIRLQPSLNK
jgi:transposase